ncbi:MULTISPECIES: hypothetical protein [Stutzerimonas]|uniref:hypothetical protein n=1 Tax=Stutzerimonas TaxID=2901164 RepID=UPI0003960EB3|nr:MULTISPECIES: hypothetical protein [Stutzerimonas]EQM77666.1 hypothetical protein L686_15340 [Stutzerimonas stutzeri MF28]KJS64971.1 MAG: hypothetical protein JL55_38200 [[Pseudomonas] sp. BICA1-14]MCW3148707.1 hypothetical protein [Stutzerimonas sp. S1]PKM03019.1 MAG: hypothetical protein CVV16_10250 [Gammaproteobacteria bacterium HGW-Gammaproteobacteria-6]|tara:strand:- start:1194 stop:1427 length:234 start_codon:yes stop_codon:yes gene_type:complete
MKIFSKEGVEMMDIKSISRDGERLIVKGKVMGAMSTTLLIKPEDCWQAARLLGLRVIMYLPLLLLKGYWSLRKKDVA